MNLETCKERKKFFAGFFLQFYGHLCKIKQKNGNAEKIHRYFE